MQILNVHKVEAAFSFDDTQLKTLSSKFKRVLTPLYETDIDGTKCSIWTHDSRKRMDKEFNALSTNFTKVTNASLASNISHILSTLNNDDMDVRVLSVMKSATESSYMVFADIDGEPTISLMEL